MRVRAAVLGVVTVVLAASLAGAGAGEEWQAKVDPWVLDTAVEGPTEMLVMLGEQADLSRAAGLSTKAAKGACVFRTLTEVAERTQGPLLAELKARGVEHRPYWVANMVWVRASLDTVRALAEREDVLHVHANPRVRLAGPVETGDGGGGGPTEAVEWNIALVNAPQVWAAGVTGAGAVVAGQDTGYLWNHPALVNQYRGGPAGNHDYNWHDAIHSGGGSCGANSPFPCDDQGHGTHTMGTIVGDDGLGNQVGMAPTAKWVGCRNMDVGFGTPTTYAECYQWFIAPTRVNGSEPDPSMAPDVVNNSWGCPPSEGCTDPNVLLTVVQNVRAAGIVTVHSAGNDGSSCSTVDTPSAIYDESFSVGATTSSDTIANYSSRGPVTVDGSNRRKPDISAPGSDIRSSTRDGGYQGGWSGTSMAGPHVAGLVALLVSAAPGLAGDVELLEEIITSTAVPRTTTQGCGGDPPTAVPNNTYGWGRVDAWAAYNYPLDFTLATIPDAVTVCAPQEAVVQVEVGQMQSFAEPVTLSATGLPAGASAAFGVNPVTPPGSSQLTVGNTAAVAPGSYPVTVVGTSSPSGVVHDAAFDLSVFNQAAGAVTPQSPANGAHNQPLRPAFAWSAATQAASYRLQVATDPGFATVVLDVAGISGASFTPSEDLASSALYHWRITASNPCGAGPTSEAFTFATVALPGDCGLGTAPAVHFQDTFESGAPGWSSSGTGNTWALSSARSHSGSFAYHAVDPPTTSDQRLVSPAVTLPASAAALTLQFWNWQQMEPRSTGCWDGGVVEISTTDGSSWTPLPNAVMLTDPYDGPVYALSSLDGWCGDPQDWLKAVVDVGAFAGETVRFRFRLGSDSSVGREGWYVDDVLVQSCLVVETPLFGDGFEDGTTNAWSAVAP